MSGLRVFRLAQDGTLGAEVPAASVLSLVRSEEVNGDVSAKLASAEPFCKGERVLVRSADGTWREYEAAGVSASAQADGSASWDVTLVWTLYGDLDAAAQGGLKMPKGPRAALEQVVSGTCWEVGEVGVAGSDAVGMYYESRWECLAAVVEAFGGEVRADVSVSPAGAVTRRLSLPAQLGSRTCARRFDWGADLTAISRAVDDSPVYARIVPRGKGEESGDGWGRRVTVTSVNGGKEYVQDDEAAAAFRRPDGEGGWAYPTKVVVDESIEEPAELLEWAHSVLHDYTRPKVTYKASVAQLARAGMDAQGVALGDPVQCVDRGFGPSGLRVEGRVTALESDELDPTDTELTIGSLASTIADDIAGLRDSVSQVRRTAEQINGGGLDASAFMARLLERINSELNATGGYTYLKPGEGIWVYDRAEDQGPTMAVNIKGGGVRVASAKTSDGEWDWRTVMTAGDGVVADQICTGTIRGGSNWWDLTTGDLVFEQGIIRSADGKNFWDLGTGEYSLQGVAKESQTVASVDVEYALGDSPETAPETGWATKAPAWQAGRYMWQRTKTVSGSGAVSYSSATCIQGAAGKDGERGPAGSDGEKGDAGRGIKAVVEQYYLSTSQTSQAGGAWSTSQPAWAKGKYIWTRSQVTWSDGAVTTTAPVLARTVNGANQAAQDAKDGVSDLDGKLTQQEIFNRLTNDGQTQGIYLQGGKVYLNGEYIKAGTVSVDELVSNSTTYAGQRLLRLVAGKDGTGSSLPGSSKVYWSANLSAFMGSDEVESVRFSSTAYESRMTLFPLAYADGGAATRSVIGMCGTTTSCQYRVELSTESDSSGKVWLQAKLWDNSSGSWSQHAAKKICALN